MAVVTAYDLKSKVQNLIVAAQDVSSYLNSLVNRIDEATRPVLEQEKKLVSLRNEQQSLEKSIAESKRRLELDYAAHQERIGHEQAAVATLKKTAANEREEAARLLADAQAKHAAASAKLEETETRRRAMEAKAAQLKEILG